MADGVLTDADAEEIAAQASAQVEEAIAFAKDSPLPDPAHASAYVFA